MVCRLTVVFVSRTYGVHLISQLTSAKVLIFVERSFEGSSLSMNGRAKMSRRGSKRTGEVLPKPQKTPPELKKLKKEKKAHVNQLIALELVRSWDDNRKRADRKVVKEIFDRYKVVYGEDQVDRNSAYRFRSDILEGRASAWLPRDATLPSHVSCYDDQGTAVSTLTDGRTVTSPSSTIASPSTGGSPNTDSTNVGIKKSGGRPKGTTDAAKEDYEDRIERAYMHAVMLFAYRRCEAGRKKLANGTAAKVCREAEEHLSLKENSIKVETMLSRYKRGNVDGRGKGHVSPVEAMEPILVDFCIKLARMGQPLGKEQVLCLANDLIKGTESQERLVEYKKKHTSASSEDSGTLGRRWYENFMKRNKKHIKRVATRTADIKRHQYITRENFEIMYESVYKTMVEAGVAEELEEGEYIMHTQEGKETSVESEAVGLKTKYRLTKPDDIFFVDETGDNTNQKEEARIGQEKMIVPRDGSCNGKNGSVADSHYTLFVFQTSLGKPVCVCIIFKSTKSPEEMPPNWRTGIDVTKASELCADSDNRQLIQEASQGVCGGAPVCTFRGKRILPYITCSPKASITSEILAGALAHIDSFNVFDRANGKKPFLLLDGHGSRFGLPFLRYIHDKRHPWVVHLGVPYATHWWQVADSSQVNGSYKMAATEKKRKIYEWKHPRGQTLNKTDIVPIVNYAFARSFGLVDRCKRAIASRGWNPLNYALLCNEDLKKIFEAKEMAHNRAVAAATTNTDQTVDSSAERPNLDTGSGRTYLDKILREQYRSEGKRQQMQRAREEEDKETSAVARIHEITKGKATSGSQMAQANLVLHDGLLQKALHDKETKDAEEARLAEGRTAKRIKKLEELNEAINRHRSGKKLRGQELTILLKHVHRDTDAKLPTKVDELKPLWEERKGRLVTGVASV